MEDYRRFIAANQEVMICFVNDGSTDTTKDVLEQLKADFDTNVAVVDNPSNSGKAASVRNGMLHCLENYQFEHIAYIDADLAVSLEECLSMTEKIDDTVHFCFGSRIARVGSTIDRKRYRFLIGRTIATFISIALDLKVYDTQCGCKVFTRELASKVFDRPFISKWLFDVEIIFRLYEVYGKKESIQHMQEVPLARWVDRGDSKVKFSYVFKLFFDLNKIRKQYRHTKTNG